MHWPAGQWISAIPDGNYGPKPGQQMSLFSSAGRFRGTEAQITQVLLQRRRKESRQRAAQPGTPSSDLDSTFFLFPAHLRLLRTENPAKNEGKRHFREGQAAVKFRHAGLWLAIAARIPQCPPVANLGLAEPDGKSNEYPFRVHTFTGDERRPRLSVDLTLVTTWSAAKKYLSSLNNSVVSRCMVPRSG